MDTGDLILSDIHVHSPLPVEDKQNIYFSTRFFFCLKNDLVGNSYQQHGNEGSGQTSTQTATVAKQDHKSDEDGDIIVSTRQDRGDISENVESVIALNLHSPLNGKGPDKDLLCREALEVITLEHKLQTTLKDVGYQVWLGALLLCDYLIDCGDTLKPHSVLDTGAGTGLTSIVAAMFAKSVICTDCNQELVSLAEKNWKRNCDLLPSLSSKPSVTFQVLDWTKHGLDTDNTSCSTSPVKDAQDVLNLYNASLIIAAEVVYDNDLTDAFFRTIYFLLRKPPCKTVIMAVERRIVFDAAWQDVSCPAYEHFQENLTDLCSVDEGNVRFACQQIPTKDMSQYFLYNRTAQLELWKLTSSFPESTIICKGDEPG